MSESPPPLDGRRVLVVGASSGIGLLAAQRLAREGARVVLLSRGGEALGHAAREVPGCAGALAADVTDSTALHAALAEAAGLLGGIDVVVSAAGAAVYGPFSEMSPEDYERTIATTLVGMLNTAHAALPHLERTAGTLVVIGSVAGRLPTPWLSAYAAAKHGVRGFVRTLSCELRAQRSAVSLALIAPGPVDTPFWRRARTTDGRLPPEVHGAYRPEEIVEEIVRAATSPGRLERTVGGLMAVATLVDALAPNFVLAPLGVVARLGWRSRDRHPESDEDALSQPSTEAQSHGGLLSRPSALTRLRELATPPW